MVKDEDNEKNGSPQSTANLLGGHHRTQDSLPRVQNSVQPIERLLERLDDVRPSWDGESYTACCPAHDDRNPSLSIREAEDGRVLVYCHAGCETQDVLAAIYLEWSDLFPATNVRHTRRGGSHE